MTSTVITTLSAARVSTYLRVNAGDETSALELYSWNARIAAALMLPTHFAEVSTRNAVSDALTAVYGDRWPWAGDFFRSLPSLPKGSRGYDMKRDLAQTRAREKTTGKVIAELKFVFWQKMFTARNDHRLWRPHIKRVFPNAPTSSVGDLRDRVYSDLEAVRQLRNRLAHHEPVFTRDLTSDLTRMLDLVHLRCAETSSWVRALEDATAVLGERP